MKFLLNYLTKITFFCVYSRKAHEKKKQRKTGTAWRWRWKIIDKSCKSNFWQFLLIFGYYPQRLCQTEKTE